MSHIQLVLDRMRTAGLMLSPDKSHFFKKECTFLGHVLNKDGLMVDPRNI